MSLRIYILLSVMVFSCHSLTLKGKNDSETSTSPTISVQRFRSSTFYNYVKLAPTVPSKPSDVTGNAGTEPPATSQRRFQGKDDMIVFSETQEDAERVSTFSPNTSDDASATEHNSGEVPPSANDGSEDGSGATSDNNQAESNPDSENSGSENGNTEASAPESPGSAEPVPGQPGEDALENAEDSSDSDSSSSSSSSSEEFIAKKVLKQKFKNDLVNKQVKSKESFSEEEPKKAIRKNRHRKFL